MAAGDAADAPGDSGDPDESGLPPAALFRISRFSCASLRRFSRSTSLHGLSTVTSATPAPLPPAPAPTISSSMYLRTSRALASGGSPCTQMA